MKVSAVSVGRVSENLKMFSLLDTLKTNTLSLFNQQNRIASGYKLLAPSDDPIGAASVMHLNQILDQQDQVLTNLKLADGFLSATDSSIVDINSLLIEAQSLASEQAGNLTDQSQRDAAAVMVNSILDQLVMLGNTTYQGRYLFGGQRVDQPPFVRDSGFVQFVGDTGDLRTHVDDWQEEAYNLTGDRLFGALSSEVASWRDWNPLLTSDTRLKDCGGTTGKGIQLGSIEISETAVTSFTVDLAKADSIGDVVDMINQAAMDAGSSVTAAVNAAGNGIQLTSGGPTIEVKEVTEGKTARDLGILTSGPVATVAGADVLPRLTLMTRLGDLGNVAMADLAGGFVITNGDESATINTGALAATDTVQDLLNTINGAGVKVAAEINAAGTGINIVNTLSGSLMSVGENGGTTAEALGIRSMHLGTALSDLNQGLGVEGRPGESDFRIVARDGSSFEVNINDASGGLDTNGDGYETVEDVLFAINSAAAAAGVAVTATLALDGNGIRIVDTTGAAGTLRIERSNLSYAVDDLGLAGLEATGAGASVEVVGSDVNGITPNSVFTVLHQLQEALLTGDTRGITMAGGKLDTLMTSVNHVLGQVGSRSKAMTDRYSRTQDAVDATRKALSEVQDLDYTEAIARFQQAQTALQANLMTASQMLSLSLLDFLQ